MQLPLSTLAVRVSLMLMISFPIPLVGKLLCWKKQSANEVSQQPTGVRWDLVWRHMHTHGQWVVATCKEHRQGKESSRGRQNARRKQTNNFHIHILQSGLSLLPEHSDCWWKMKWQFYITEKERITTGPRVFPLFGFSLLISRSSRLLVRLPGGLSRADGCESSLKPPQPLPP